METTVSANYYVVADSTKLDRSLAHSFAWTAAVKAAIQFVTWVSTFVVARLLTPDDYGLVTMATVFLGVVTMVSEFGLGMTIVTLRHLDREQVAQLNSLAVLLGLASFVVTAALAVPLGAFFHSDKLPAVLLVLATTFVISGFRVVPNAMLERDLKFRRLAVFEGANGLVVAGGSVLLAWLGFRYWTLVLSAVLGAAVVTALTVMSRPHPFRRPRWDRLRGAASFTGYQLGSNLLWYGYSNADFLVAGKLLGKAELGAYSLAWSIANTIPEKITTLVVRLMPAYFSAIQEDLEALRRYLLRLTEILALVTFPALLGIAMIAGDFVPIILGPRWIPAIWPLRLICIYAAFNATTPLLSRVLTARGDMAYLMRFGVGMALLMPLTFLIGSRWGPTGIAAGWVTMFPLTRIPLIRRTAEQIGISSWDYLRAHVPATTSALAMITAVAILQRTFPSDVSPAIRMGAEILLGMLTYVGWLFLCHRTRFDALLRLLRWRGAAGITGEAG